MADMMFWGRTGKTLFLAMGLFACGNNEVILEGERIALREAPEATEPAAAPPKLVLPKAVANSQWTHENSNIRHAPGHLAGSYPLEPVWAVAAGSGASRQGRITAGPVVFLY